jgi:hypothetical protein
MNLSNGLSRWGQSGRAGTGPVRVYVSVSRVYDQTSRADEDGDEDKDMLRCWMALCSGLPGSSRTHTGCSCDRDCAAAAEHGSVVGAVW